MFAMIVNARMKARDDMATMTGWYAERMAREGKRLKPLGKYLMPARPKTAAGGARDVHRMFQRLIARQGDEHGAG